MNDICVPLPRLPQATHAEVEVKVAGRTRSFNYRIESFAWHPDDEITPQMVLDTAKRDRISSLKHAIEGYDKNWELVQIYNPGPRDSHIQVLFRQRPQNSIQA